jgi:hypothetical protein
MNSSRTPGDKASSNASPEHRREPAEESLAARIGISTSGLLSSVARPGPAATTSGLDAATPSSASKSSQQRTGSSFAADSSSWSEATSSRPDDRSTPGTQFRTRTSLPCSLATEGDFTKFSASNTVDIVSVSEPISHGQSSGSFASHSDGSAVASLLSRPLATSEIYSEEMLQSENTANTSHPAVVAFAECEDPVEFLRSNPEWSKYTDSVWGNLLELMQDAQKEADKGKAKEDYRPSVEKLKLAWEQLRSKL